MHANVKGNKLKEWLLKKAIASKQYEIEKHIVRNNGIWDKLVFKSVREGLGGKVRLMVCGSAPLSANVLEFMRCALGCVVRQLLFINCNIFKIFSLLSNRLLKDMVKQNVCVRAL